jgi:hypothetical protein
MQTGGKHYVSFNDDGNEFSFTDKFNSPLLTLNKDIKLRCLFIDASTQFSQKKNYVGIIFWGKGFYRENKTSRGMEDIYVASKWIESSARLKYTGGEAFNAGTVIIMESDNSKSQTSAPHWKLWEKFFGKSYKEFIIENPDTFYLMTGFSWNSIGKQFIFRSGLANSTNLTKGFIDNPIYSESHSHIRDNLITTGDTIENIRTKNIDITQKEEDTHLQQILQVKLNELFTNNCNPYNNSYNPPVKWYRISPDHTNQTIISPNSKVSLIEDKHLIWTLENGLNMRGLKYNCPKPKKDLRIHQYEKVYTYTYTYNDDDLYPNLYLSNEYWTSELYHKSSTKPDDHVYYFDYHNMTQIDIWYEGLVENDQIRMSHLVRDPIFRSDNEDHQRRLLNFVNSHIGRSRAEVDRAEVTRAEVDRARARADRAKAGRAEVTRAELDRAEAEVTRAEVARAEVDRARAEAGRARSARARAEVTRAEVARAEADRARSEVARAKVDRARAEVTRADVARAEADRARSEVARAKVDRARAEAGRARSARARAEVTRAEVARAEADRASSEVARAEVDRARADRAKAGRAEADRTRAEVGRAAVGRVAVGRDADDKQKRIDALFNTVNQTRNHLLQPSTSVDTKAKYLKYKNKYLKLQKYILNAKK